MTLLFPDVSQFQGGISLQGAAAACARASEGDWLTDPTFAAHRAQAAMLGIPFHAYHFMEDKPTPEAQAKHCFGIAGKTPMMVDLEPIPAPPSAGPEAGGHTAGSAWKWLDALGHTADLRAAAFISKPTIAQALAFVDAYRKLGGVCHLLYHPHWYWQVLGSPSLKPFADRDMALVSSQYVTTYSNTGPGWDSYGGMDPQVWQFTDHRVLNGVPCDYNSFKGTPAELHSLAATGRREPQPWRVWETAGKRSLAEIAAACGMTPHRVLHATARHFAQDDPVTVAYVNGVFEGTIPPSAKVPAGALLWVQG